MTVLAETVSNTDSSVFILPFWVVFFGVGGRHFNETVMPLSFSHFVAVVPPLPILTRPLLLACVQTVLTLHDLNPLNFLAQRKQKCFREKKRKRKKGKRKCSPAVHKFALRSLRTPLLSRQLKPRDVFQPAFTSNKLCRIPGSGSRSSEDNAALGGGRGGKKKGKSLFLSLTY